MQEKLFPVFGIVLLVFGEEESASSDDVGFKATGVEYEILFELSGANDDRFCWKKEE